MWKRRPGSNELNDEIDRELEHHLELRARDLTRRGLDADEARRQARLELGARPAKTEECREARGLFWLDEARRHTAFALRQLRRNPAFAISAILTLGLCIGVNTAIFSAVDALLLRRLPYPEPERLGMLAVHLAADGLEDIRLAHEGRDWETIRDHAEAVEAAVFRMGASGRNLAVGDQAQFVREQRVSAGFLRVLGVPPAFGREFRPEEDRPGGPAVTMISYRLATRLFGHAADAVGRTIQLKGEPSLVVGVAPPGFVSSSPADVWTPLRPSTQGEGAGTNYNILVRAKGDRSLEAAEAATAPLLEEVFDIAPLRARGLDVTARLRLVPLKEGFAQGKQDALMLLWAAGAAVLFIGCVNIAGLLIARLESRSHELALRRSLGGGRVAVARQLLTESLTLGMCGGAAGVLIGYTSLGWLRTFLREGLSMWNPVVLDARALAVTAAIALGSGLLLGLYPAWRGSRLDPGAALDSGPRVTGGRSIWLRRLLIAGQTCACLLLLAGAGLMLRTLENLWSLAPGFEAAGVTVGDVSLDDARYATAEAASRLFEGALDRMADAPGIVSAGVGQTLPYERAVNLGFSIVGEEEESGYRPTDVVYVAGAYFETLRIPLIQGRLLGPRDRASAEPAVLVNRAFVERNLRGREPLATYLSLRGAKRRIVGVVGDVPHKPGWGGSDMGPLTAMPTVYLPAAQMEDRALALVNMWSTPSFVVRSNGPPAAAVEAIRSGVGAVDPLLPFASFRTMEEVQGQAWAMQKVQAILISALAGLALLLAAVGLYGLIATAAEDRKREAAIRMALGAAAWQTVRAVALPGIGLAAAGIVTGLALVPTASGLIESLVWGVEAGDPLALAVAAGTLAVTALLASLTPAARLLRVQPASLLRDR